MKPRTVGPHECFAVTDDVFCLLCGADVPQVADDDPDLSQDPLVNDRPSFDADSYYGGDAA